MDDTDLVAALARLLVRDDVQAEADAIRAEANRTAAAPAVVLASGEAWPTTLPGTPA